jgi:hypothetical protein
MGAILPSPSLSTQLSDALENQVMKGRAQHQPVQATLLFQELTTLLHSNPVATDLLLSSISKNTKNLKSSSNRGRKDGISHSKYRVGKVKCVKIGARIGANSTPNKGTAPDSLADPAHQRGTWKTMELLAGLLAANLITK